MPFKKLALRFLLTGSFNQEYFVMEFTLLGGSHVKLFLFFSALLLSCNASAALFTSIVGGASNPMGGYYESCGETSCTAGYANPYVYENALDPGDSLNNENYFSIGTDVVDREMSNGLTYVTAATVTVLIEWVTFDVFDAQLYYAGERLNLPGNGSGSLIYTILNPFIDEFTFSFAISGKANSLDSFVEYTFSKTTPPIETPIPASFFLFAPALLGLFGFRRKLS
jgi:hypothetical protein